MRSTQNVLEYSDCSETDSLLVPDNPSPRPSVYKSRYWVLTVISIFSCLACWQWNTWGPINETMAAVYGWDTATIALLVNLSTGIFMLSVWPVCWLVENLSMRPSMLITSALTTIALAIRCFTADPAIFTILCYISATILGISLTFVLTIPPLIANDWFPQNERASAQAIMFSTEQLGLLVSYLEPLLVQLPSSQISTSVLKDQINTLLYIGAGCCLVVSMVTLVYFPSRPPSPPSHVAESVRTSLYEAAVSFLKKRDLCIMLLCYTLCTGPAFAWVTVLNFSLLPLDIHQDEAMWIGGIGVIMSVFTTILTGRFIDKYPQYLKRSLVTLLLVSSTAFYWFLLISENVINYAKWQVYASVAIGLSVHYAALPVLYVLTTALAYPSKDVVVGGILALADNVSACIFLVLYQLPIGVSWVPYALVFSCAAVIPPVLFISVPEPQEEAGVVTDARTSSSNIATNAVAIDEARSLTSSLRPSSSYQSI